MIVLEEGMFMLEETELLEALTEGLLLRLLLEELLPPA